MKEVKLLMALLIALVFSQSYAGKCFDLNSPNIYPTPDFPVYVDLQKSAAKDLVLQKIFSTETPKGSSIIDGDRVWPQFNPYDPSGGVVVWPNRINPDLHNAPLPRKPEKNSDGRYESLFIYFYEPDPAGGKRVCRVEEWEPRGEPHRHDYRAQWREPSIKNVSFLEKLAEAYAPNKMSVLLYEAEGRVSEVLNFDFSKYEPPSSKSWRLSSPQQCYLWRKDGKLARFVSDLGEFSICNEIKPGNASYFDYKYADSGQFAGSMQMIEGNWRKPGDIEWSAIYRYRTERYIEAEANNLWGVHYLRGLPQIEDVPDRVLPDDELAAFYRFPQYTPISVMDGLPLSIKAYRRIRQGPAGAGTVSEMFPPNGGLTERIFWRSYGGTVFRHERFRNGKPYRIINDGLLDQEKIRAGTYNEDLATLDRVISQPKINVPRANIRLRVYDVDATGHQTLVALSWSKRVEEPYYESPSRARLWRDVKQGIASALKSSNKPKPTAPKPATAEELRVRYTDVTGKEIWKDWDVFVAKTGYIQTISEFYPYGNPESRKPPLENAQSPLR